VAYLAAPTLATLALALALALPLDGRLTLAEPGLTWPGLADPGWPWPLTWPLLPFGIAQLGSLITRRICSRPAAWKGGSAVLALLPVLLLALPVVIVGVVGVAYVCVVQCVIKSFW
jgi:hypothetical protein